MTNYMLVDGDGNALAQGLNEHDCRQVAQRRANDLQRNVWLHKDGADDADAGEEFRPTSPKWTTWGSVRGLGSVRNTRQAAETDLQVDQVTCRAQGGYSDRQLYMVDLEGWVIDWETGANVFPHGRGHAALRV